VTHARVRWRPSRRLVTVVLPATAISLALLAISAAAAIGAVARPATGSIAVTAASTAGTARVAASTGDSFRETKTVTRVNLIDGKNVVVDKRTVSLTVTNTANLINREPIDVSWTGARPTAGVDPDGPNPNGDIVDNAVEVNGPAASFQEYPMVLLECHGTAKTIQPEDCWTTEYGERVFLGSGSSPFPPWRLDRYATAAGQRNLTVGVPNPLPANCSGWAGVLKFSPSYWLPYVTPSGTTYSIGLPYTTPQGTEGECGGASASMDTDGGVGILPSNEAYAATALNGKGSDHFDVWTGEADSDLGCSQTVACALVAIPIMGISCDPAMTGMPADDQIPANQEQQAAAWCEQTGAFLPGQETVINNYQNADLSVTGQLWWAASNWRNRFVVPLTFAPPGNICNIVNTGHHIVDANGSELLDQAQLQWQPHFCLNRKLFTLDYVQEPEPEAAGSLQTTEQAPGTAPAGSVEAALVSDQPVGGFDKPVVHAPVAATGFAISFIIDNAAGQQVTTLRLDPRLLAKLLTESYPGESIGEYGGTDPELTHPCPGVPIPGSKLCTNPESIMQDPEFLALNPGLSFNASELSADSEAASTLLALSTQSDVMYALTSYINANPEARAWLNGKPDPWGMTVNTKYRGKKLTLPTSEWPLNSTWDPPGWTNPNNAPNNECYYTSPTPVLPLIAAPVPDLPDIAEDVQFANVQSTLTCAGFNPDDPLATDGLSAAGEQVPGGRFMIGVTSLADADRYSLTNASLETYNKPGLPAAFTSADVAKDMTFVAPSDASMQAATALLVADNAGREWSFPYSLYRNDSKIAASAYPGTMLVYMDVPTSDLPTADATDFADFIRYVVTTGQQPGGGVGQLAAGYLPMTAANHLGGEVTYALSAASAIAAQKGANPPLVRKRSGQSGSSPSASSSTSSSTSSSSSASSSASASPSPSASPSTTSLKHAKTAAQLTPMQSFGVAGYLLPAIAGVLIAGAAAAFAVSRFSGWQSRFSRWRSR
jgi:hypothetical protein